MTSKISIPAKRSLGQNFLVNEGVLDRIVSAADIHPSDTVLEIGPGRGALTQKLAETGAHIIAVEKDRRLITPLTELFAAHANVAIREGDVLKLDTDDLSLKTGAYKLVANIPYYLTGHLFRLMLEAWPPPSCAVLMVQREVADRIMAEPPDMNLLALSVRLHATPSIVMRVSRGSFRPIPDVDSAVVRLALSPLTAAERSSNKDILAIAKQAFGQKRKQLTASIDVAILQAAGIPPQARPQELSADDWRRVALAFH